MVVTLIVVGLENFRDIRHILENTKLRSLHYDNCVITSTGDAYLFLQVH